LTELRVPPVLITGATGRTGRVVIDLLLERNIPVDDRDVAEVVARTLYQDGHAGGDYVITGPQALAQSDQVAIIGEVLGLKVRFEEVSAAQFREQTEGTWSRPVVDMLLEAWAATMGVTAYVTNTVSEILGRPALTFRQRVQEQAG
jgi:uncharacterized protein YbjT (DUF2867 family)